MKTFTSTSKHKAQVPMTVTKAADILITICNRSDTYNIIGNREIGNNRQGYQVPVKHSVMSQFIGVELAFAFQDAMSNPALKEYFDRICERVAAASISIAWSKEYWNLNKLPAKENEEMMHGYAYGMEQLAEQQPFGFTVSEENDVGKAY